MPTFNLKYDVRESAPTIALFHRSNHPFRIVCGPIGGGKSTACCTWGDYHGGWNIGAYEYINGAIRVRGFRVKVSGE